MKSRVKESPQRILIRGVNWLGDAVMTMPALCRLREIYPHAYIAVLTPAKLADLYRYQPAVDAVIIAEQDEPARLIAARIRVEKFDTALILTNSARSALPFWLAAIPRRVGYGGRGRTLLLSDPVRPETSSIKIYRRSAVQIKRLCAIADSARVPNGPERTEPPVPFVHHVTHYLHLAAALGADKAAIAPHLIVPVEDVRAVINKFCLPVSEPHQPVFGLNPGAEYGLAKRWPEDHYVDMAIAVQKRIACRWIVFGGARDQELAARITEAIQAATSAASEFVSSSAAQSTVWNLAGKTSLTDLCAALQVCDVVVGNDTGPMHVAAAVGTRVVAPFGSTSPEISAPGVPGGVRHCILRGSAPCAPCFQRVCPIDFRCMKSITIAEVSEAVLQLYNEAIRL